MKKFLTTAALIGLTFGNLSGLAHAQTTVVADPGHPRVNQVDQRLQNQQTRVDNGVAAGTVGAKQEARDNKTDAKVANEVSRDEAKNGGTLTKAEQNKMNRQLDKNSTRIAAQKSAGAATGGATAH